MRAFVRFAAFVVLACVFLLSSLSLFASSTTIAPTTTLTAETSNNTSGASSFTSSTNGNIAPANVSKVDHHSLLYPGATTKIYTNIMHWFGPANHIQVGYKSNDPAQVQKQVDDHVSRGIDGAIVDWYGPGHIVDDTATQLMMRYAETLPGLPFHFAIMEDKGALLKCSQTVGCNVNNQLISDLTYIYNVYAGSPAYLKVNGRPLIFFFDVDNYAINWDYVKASVPGNPMFIFQNSGGLAHADTSGAFSWVMINTSNPNDWKQSYLDNFYAQALKNPGMHSFGATYKGFNDTLASWSMNRVMNQNCGQVWLNTWNEVPKYYSASNQLEFMQIVTWNDYEEGTAIETGIENCVSLNAAVSGQTVTWNVFGNENTIDHYTVFVSLDGENLMSLGDTSRGIHALDLAQFSLAPGSYTLYVKAVGRPSMTNKMSGPVTFAVDDPGPVITFSVTPASGIAPVTVTASTAGSSSPAGSVTSTIDFGDGTRVNATSASHTYSAPGTYTVTGTVYDSFNKSDTATTIISVVANKAPVAYLAVTPASGPAPVTVTASTSGSRDDDGRIVSSMIDFGDGATANSITASHTYTRQGSYTVTGILTDNYGATSQTSATVTVTAPAVPGAVTVLSPANGATVSSPVHFVASATANAGNTISSMRIYVEGTSAYTVYAAALDTWLSISPGTHSVVVQSWDNTGIVYKNAFAITVAAPNKSPVVALAVNPTSATTGVAVAASMAGSIDPDGTIAAYSIDFGDGTVANAISASHAYAAPGTYTVKATATDNVGASTVALKSITITQAYGVVVASPANGSTVGSSVHFVASAASKYPITAMRIYADGISQYTVNASRLDAYVALPGGTHQIVIQAWDSTGAVFKAPLTINVSCGTCLSSRGFHVRSAGIEPVAAATP